MPARASGSEPGRGRWRRRLRFEMLDPVAQILHAALVLLFHRLELLAHRLQCLPEALGVLGQDDARNQG
jgi:hypothetical protein